MERLSARGHEVRVIDFEILWREHEKSGIISRREIFNNVHKATSNGGNVTVIRPPIIKLPGLDYISLIYTHRSEIKRQIAEFKPDIIIGFGILNANIAIQLAKKRDIPFVYYIIDELHRLVPQKSFQGLARFIESKNMKSSHGVLSINEGLREYTIEMGADPKATEVIRAGVDLERFSLANGSTIREKYNLKENDVVLFFMGWLYDFSGLKEVATELAKSENDKFKLLILGKGDLWDDLQIIKTDFGLDGRLITVDWSPYEEVPGYVAASDICILPAHKNGIMMNIVPIKMYEYMAARKPVIATNLPGLKKEFGEGNGVVYVEGPEDALRMAIKMADSIDEAGEAARRFVEKCGWDSITNEFEGVLEAAVHGK